jgi:hypothetical protein
MSTNSTKNTDTNPNTNEVDERILQLRQVLLQTVVDKYKALIETIDKITYPQDYKTNAIYNINQGFLWAKEGIGSVTFNFEPLAEAAIESEEVTKSEKVRGKVRESEKVKSENNSGEAA